MCSSLTYAFYGAILKLFESFFGAGSASPSPAGAVGERFEDWAPRRALGSGRGLDCLGTEAELWKRSVDVNGNGWNCLELFRKLDWEHIWTATPLWGLGACCLILRQELRSANGHRYFGMQNMQNQMLGLAPKVTSVYRLMEHGLNDSNFRWSILSKAHTWWHDATSPQIATFIFNQE